MKSALLSACILASLYAPEAQAANIRIENQSSTDSLFVGAIFESNASSSTLSQANGFWKIEPGNGAVLRSDDSNVQTLWLRILVKNGETRREYVPINSEYLDLRGERDCQWEKTEPASFTCATSRRFGLSSGDVRMTLGTAETTNHLRSALERKERYKFFRVNRDSNKQFVFVWK